MKDFYGSASLANSDQVDAMSVGFAVAMIASVVPFFWNFGFTLPLWLKLANVFFSSLNLTIARIGQTIGLFIDSIIHTSLGLSPGRRSITVSLVHKLLKKYAGALIACLVFEYGVYAFVACKFGRTGF